MSSCRYIVEYSYWLLKFQVEELNSKKGSTSAEPKDADEDEVSGNSLLVCLKVWLIVKLSAG